MTLSTSVVALVLERPVAWDSSLEEYESRSSNHETLRQIGLLPLGFFTLLKASCNFVIFFTNTTGNVDGHDHDPFSLLALPTPERPSSHESAGNFAQSAFAHARVKGSGARRHVTGYRHRPWC